MMKIDQRREHLKSVAAELEKQHLSLYVCVESGVFPTLAVKSYLNNEDLVKVLSDFGKVVLLDMSNKHDYEWAIDNKIYFLDRTKTTVGYGPHVTILDRGVSIVEHLKGSDFTWQAIAIDAHTGEVFDPMYGSADVSNKVMRHCHYNISSKPKAVMDMAFYMSKFSDWTLFPVTKTICQSMVNFGYIGWGQSAEDLLNTTLIKPMPAKDVWDGFKNGLLGPNPKRFISVLNEIGWLNFVPVLSVLTGNSINFNTALDLLDSTTRLAIANNMSTDDRLVLSMLSFLGDIGKGIDAGNHVDLSWILSDMALTGIACPADIKNKITNIIKCQHVSVESNALEITSLLDVESIKLLEWLYLIKGELTTPIKNVFDKCYKIGKFTNIVDEALLGELGYTAPSIIIRLIAESRKAQIRGEIKDRNTAIGFLTQLWEEV